MRQGVIERVTGLITELWPSAKVGTSVWCNPDTHTHTHPFNGPFSWTTRVGRYQKGKTNLDCTEARDMWGLQ